MYDGWTPTVNTPEKKAYEAEQERLRQAERRKKAASRPLIEYPTYFERNYCPECMITHMVEMTRDRRVLCHGEDYYFRTQQERTHYSRRQGKGFELAPITSPAQLPLEWQMVAELKEPEYIDVDQDW